MRGSSYGSAGLERRIQFVFQGLIFAQAAHSIEESIARLYEVWAPARFVASLISRDPATGFVIANALLVIFALLCWAVPVRLRWKGARGVMWFWSILELSNGAGHIVLALLRGAYFPGVATAPLLLLFGGWLAVLLAR